MLHYRLDLWKDARYTCFTHCSEHLPPKFSFWYLHWNGRKVSIYLHAFTVLCRMVKKHIYQWCQCIYIKLVFEGRIKLSILKLLGKTKIMKTRNLLQSRINFNFQIIWHHHLNFIFFGSASRHCFRSFFLTLEEDNQAYKYRFRAKTSFWCLYC